ncbi:transcriptional regulator [Shewanella sp. GutCb]|uniref:winged helix-turn-helix transcriptional regulator n=1 Tax=Shewanella sp. GutCb TaxID=2058315 RepID=UPI000C79A66B|nr:helix-turn-helix domain-containing protein [Shewanella sp. GutCb]PKG75579.1 transcriptional regulator [Shewanella sp. GutCb]
MSERGKKPEGYCSADKYLTIISTKWTAHIVWVIGQHNEIRFGQIQKQLALVSSKVLSERLRILKKEGFISRRPEETVPITVYYGLTSKGVELFEVIDVIVKKADFWDGKLVSV